MIVNWDRTRYSEQIIHIHGDKDHTIPIKNLEYDYLIEGWIPYDDDYPGP